ncbi:unnamed protein product [Calypogeia fissa]
MIEEILDEGIEENLEWKVVPFSRPGSGGFVEAQRSAKCVIVGAGARVLFYPTLLYNLVRNKLQAEFRWWDQIDQFLLLGAVPFPGDVLRLKAIGVRAVVTLNESYETLVPSTMYKDHGINHLVIPTRDYLFAPSMGDIRRAVAFIHGHTQHGQTTYVHCKAGRGRSTTVVLCYLVEHRGMDPIDALQYVRGKRPRVLLANAQWQAVQEYSKQIKLCHGLSMPSALQHMLPCFREANAFVEPVNSVSTTGTETAVRSSESGGFDIEDLPVVITSVDLTGYKSIEDAGLIGNALWDGLGVVYRVRFMAARSVVNAVRVARASMEWARLSCLVIGCQADGKQVLDSHSHLTVDAFCSSAVRPKSKVVSSTLLGEQVSMPRLNLPICQSGMVNG